MVSACSTTSPLTSRAMTSRGVLAGRKAIFAGPHAALPARNRARTIRTVSPCRSTPASSRRAAMRPAACPRAPRRRRPRRAGPGASSCCQAHHPAAPAARPASRSSASKDADRRATDPRCGQRRAQRLDGRAAAKFAAGEAAHGLHPGDRVAQEQFVDGMQLIITERSPLPRQIPAPRGVEHQAAHHARDAAERPAAA
jgi:hypothetical protein